MTLLFFIGVLILFLLAMAYARRGGSRLAGIFSGSAGAGREGNSAAPNRNPLHEDQEIDQLIAECRFGTAAEILQARLKRQPENFTLFMSYIQLLAVYCANSAGASVAIRERSRVRGFSAQEYEELKRNLQQWGKHDVLVA